MRPELVFLSLDKSMSMIIDEFSICTSPEGRPQQISVGISRERAPRIPNNGEYSEANIKSADGIYRIINFRIDEISVDDERVCFSMVSDHFISLLKGYWVSACSQQSEHPL